MKNYTPEEQKKIFAKNLNKYIYLTGKQQKEVARDLDMSPTTFNTWCMGKILPNTAKLNKLCLYFNCKLTDLVDDKSGDNEKLDYIFDLLKENNWECKEYTHCNENSDCPLSEDELLDKWVNDKMFSACVNCQFEKGYFLITNSANQTYKLEEEDITELYDKIMSYIKFVIQEKISTLDTLKEDAFDEQGILPDWLKVNITDPIEEAISEENNQNYNTTDVDSEWK